MTNEERIRLLEKLGYVPDDGDVIDFQLSEKTSWWGRRLDSETFWRNKVLWLDDKTSFEARRRGRSYPPIPYHDSSVDDRSDVDHRPKGYGAEGGTINFVASEKENVFWDKFNKTHPRPPKKIDSRQRSDAENWLRTKNILEHDPTYAARLRMKPERLDRMLETNRREAAIFGFPPECIAPEAYFWAYVMDNRRKYEAIESNGQDKIANIMSNFFGRLYVDQKYITEPLSAEDIKAANAWKAAYLRRLRQEKTDESYINAYLQAWNLSSNDVFGVTH